jgi:hypothetical protein
MAKSLQKEAIIMYAPLNETQTPIFTLEPNDTIFSATVTNLNNVPGTVQASAFIGDNINIAPQADVDLFQLELTLIPMALLPLIPSYGCSTFLELR